MRVDCGSDAATIARARAIRQAVFVIDQQIDPAIEWDDLDQKTIHFVGIDPATTKDIATGRAFFEGDKVTLQRIAVLSDMQGRGVGLAFVAAMIDHVRAPGVIREIHLSAQCHAIGFYEKLGFTADGPIYHEANIPHRHMMRSL
ncbi:MAG: GNAT family N-acetyltransferase [Rhizobiales bacterium]|nr:GNAT family N-acetyltransferase [Hyphomicrobiales bacterium]